MVTLSWESSTYRAEHVFVVKYEKIQTAVSLCTEVEEFVERCDATVKSKMRGWAFPAIHGDCKNGVYAVPLTSF